MFDYHSINYNITSLYHSSWKGGYSFISKQLPIQEQMGRGWCKLQWIGLGFNKNLLDNLFGQKFQHSNKLSNFEISITNN